MLNNNGKIVNIYLDCQDINVIFDRIDKRNRTMENKIDE